MLTQFQLIRLYFRSLGAQQRRRQRYTPLNQDSHKAQDTEQNCPIQSKISFIHHINIQNQAYELDKLQERL